MSDTNSAVIKAFGILEDSIEPASRSYGIPKPGYYIIDDNLKIVGKRFEQTYYARPTAATILSDYFGVPLQSRIITFNKPYFTGRLALSDSSAFPAQILTLSLIITMKNNFHLYGKPIAEDYIPLTVEVESNANFMVDDFCFPKTTEQTIPGLGETFNILPDSIELKTFVRIIKNPVLGKIELKGKIKFQACSKSVCFPPDELLFSIPLEISKTY